MGAYTRVLQAGGEIVKSIEKEEIEYQKFIDEGDMIRSVSAVIKPKEQLVDIYPVGSVKRGRITTRNAEKAAYLHYGVKGRIEASKFMDNIKKDSEVASQNAMQSEFNQILREKGL
nr:MAG TPA: hypothetical protein [Caudoviricetes sp.]